MKRIGKRPMKPPTPPLPIVALSAYERNGEPFSLAPEYAAAVCRAGGLPVLFPPQCPGGLDFIRRCDALVLTGGGDISPDFYGAAADESIHAVHPDRDAAEIGLARAAIAQGLPLLGICRGMQILNVALGGTLHLDLPKTVGTYVPHRSNSHAPVAHSVEILAGSTLARILGKNQACISSWHHQAVAVLAPGLRASAQAADGVIEAVEMTENPDVLAVQWHPEHTCADDPAQQALFRWLVERARRGRARRSADKLRPSGSGGAARRGRRVEGKSG